MFNVRLLSSPSMGMSILLDLQIAARASSLYFLRSREECLEKFHGFSTVIGNPRLIVSVGAKEFVSSDFESFCRKEGRKRDTSAPYIPEENGKIGKNMANCHLHDKSHVGSAFSWKWILVIYLELCILPEKGLFSSEIEVTPLEKMYGVKPDNSFLQV